VDELEGRFREWFEESLGRSPGRCLGPKLWWIRRGVGLKDLGSKRVLVRGPEGRRGILGCGEGGWIDERETSRCVGGVGDEEEEVEVWKL